MNKLKQILFTIFLFYTSLNAGAFQLSKKATFSLLTNTPGDELYSMFGHSAIRLTDSLNHLDIVFNYGTFNFSDPGFYYKFVRGKLKYFLSVETFDQYLWGRNPVQSVIEQQLNLSEYQKLRLFQFLQKNLLPENRYYLYDFFYDNCSTRIPDALKIILRDSISFTGFKPSDKKTYRQLIDPYMKKMPWVDLGIDMALGLPSDVTAKPEGYMFLPEHLKDILAMATIKLKNDYCPIVSSTCTLANAQLINKKVSRFSSPVFVFWAFFVFMGIISGFGLIKKKLNFWIDRFFFGFIGFVGLFILFLWLGTDHAVMKTNLNVLWAVPFHFIIIFFLGNSRFKNVISYYFLINSFICIALLAGWPVFPQQFHYSLVPIILILLMRSARLFYFYSGKLKKIINE